ncbi:MAG: hypothetical protein CM15mP120_17450 [Pseudomonadota bacterium]|nr:MAG: hypothetical protein CM15mP120_17450 [Pseudomonadota bacterium]
MSFDKTVSLPYSLYRSFEWFLARLRKPRKPSNLYPFIYVEVVLGIMGTVFLDSMMADIVEDSERKRPGAPRDYSLLQGPLRQNLPPRQGFWELACGFRRGIGRSPIGRANDHGNTLRYRNVLSSVVLFLC